MYTYTLAYLTALKATKLSFRFHGCALISSSYLVLKFAGWGCPSYKDKKSYSSSTAKDWKTTWILLLSSATITHVQFAPLGYPWGKPGLSMVPFFPFNVPPHVKMKPAKREKEKKICQYETFETACASSVTWCIAKWNRTFNSNKGRMIDFTHHKLTFH